MAAYVFVPAYLKVKACEYRCAPRPRLVRCWRIAIARLTCMPYQPIKYVSICKCFI